MTKKSAIKTSLFAAEEREQKERNLSPLSMESMGYEGNFVRTSAQMHSKVASSSALMTGQGVRCSTKKPDSILGRGRQVALEQKLHRKGDLLSTLNQHVNFVALAAEIDHIAPRPSDKRGGRQPYPTELMVRVLVLQHLYNLSEEALEYPLLDRLFFQRFCGLRHSSTIPDANTLWVFRERISAAGGADTLFDAVQRQLQQHGFIARGGQIVGATLVEAPKQHFHKEEKALLEQAIIPADWAPAQHCQKDAEASWTKKHGKNYHGYKLSIRADQKYKLIRKCRISTAEEHGTNHFEAVLNPANTSRDGWADKGYEDQSREQRINQSGWRLHIQHKAMKGKLQSDCQKRSNTHLAIRLSMCLVMSLKIRRRMSSIIW